MGDKSTNQLGSRGDIDQTHALPMKSEGFLGFQEVARPSEKVAGARAGATERVGGGFHMLPYLYI